MYIHQLSDTELIFKTDEFTHKYSNTCTRSSGGTKRKKYEEQIKTKQTPHMKLRMQKEQRRTATEKQPAWNATIMTHGLPEASDKFLII